MKTISKLLLVAILVTGMHSRISFAATLDMPIYFVSQEAEQVGTDFKLMFPGVYTPDVQYLVQDILTIAVDTLALDTDSIPMTLNAGVGADQFTFSLIHIAQDDGHTYARYRVTSVQGDSRGVPLSLGLNQWAMKAADLNGKPIRMSITAETGFDTEFTQEIAGQLIVARYTQSARLAVTSNGVNSPGIRSQLDLTSNRTQFQPNQPVSYSIRAWDNYAQSRQALVDAGYVVSFLNTGACLANDAPIRTQIHGDFRWLLAAEEPADIVSAQGMLWEPTGPVVTNRPIDITEDALQVSGIDGGTLLFRVDLADNLEPIPEQQLRVTQELHWRHCQYQAGVSYSGTSGRYISAVSAPLAFWEVPGARFFVPYMPYGEHLSQNVVLTNRSQTDTAVYLEVLEPKTGATLGLGRIAELPAHSLMRVQEQVQDALVNAGLLSAVSSEQASALTPAERVSYRLSYRLRLNIAQDHAGIHAAYRVQGNAGEHESVVPVSLH